MKKNRFMALLVALMLIGTGALAMPVRGSEGTLSLSCVRDDENLTLEAAEFQLLGTGEDGRYLIFTEDSGYLSLLSIMKPISQEELDRMNEAADIVETDLAPIAKGDRGDAVRQFQEALVAVGYLDGGADGDFGGKTEKAINDLQADLGLEQTGTADARLQMLVLSMAQPELVLENHSSVESPIASIAEKAGLDLQEVYNSGMSLDYDDITGVGFMSNGQVITYENEAETDLDMYTLTLQFGLLVQDNGGGNVTVNPAVKVGCLCVRRPVIEEVIVKSGDYRGTSPIEDVNATLDGVKTEESGVAILDAQMVEALANAQATGELKVRVNGRYNSFDIRVDASELPGLAAVGTLARGLE